MKEIHDFLKSPYYLILVFVISICSWYFYKENVGLTVMMIIGAFVLFTIGPIESLIPLLINSLFISRSLISLDKVPIFFIVCAVALVISMIFYCVKSKMNFKKSKMKLGFILLSVCGFLSLINLQTGGEHIRYFYSMVNFAILIAYVFFAESLRKGNEKYLCQSLLGLGLLLSAEFLISGFAIGSFQDKVTNLGWGGANTVAIYVNISIIATLFLTVKETKTFKIIIYFILANAQILIILMTQCRAGYLALAICLIPLIIGTYKFSQKKKEMLITQGVLLGIAAIVSFYYWDEIFELLRLAFRNGISDNGRRDLWKHGLEQFKLHKLIGNGMFGINYAFENDNRLMVMHNTFLQCLFSFGILGAISLVIHYIQKYVMVFKKFTTFKFFFLVITLSGFIHGMLDNTYFMIAYMLVLCPILAVMEKNED